MKQLVCEMCGGTDLIKQEGTFICESCGCKYSVEEARKMMIEGVVDVQGTVKVDTTDELVNLYKAARNAKEASDYITALKHYERIGVLDPDSWEALFYLVILKSYSIRNGEIESTAYHIFNSLPKVFDLIIEKITDEKERKAVVGEVVEELLSTSRRLTEASYNFYKSLTKGNGVRAVTGGVVGTISSLSHTEKAIKEDKVRRLVILHNMLTVGGAIEAFFDMHDETYKKYAVICWKSGLALNQQCKDEHGSECLSAETKQNTIESISKYDTSYVKQGNSTKPNQQQESNNGCYVATAVYGSYDCPQVWTLRRYRDYSLAKTWYGRAFIHVYYATSPTLVKWFGHTNWFKKIWKHRLDKMVKDLQNQGFESTPYQDKKW